MSGLNGLGSSREEVPSFFSGLCAGAGQRAGGRRAEWVLRGQGSRRRLARRQRHPATRAHCASWRPCCAGAARFARPRQHRCPRWPRHATPRGLPAPAPGRVRRHHRRHPRSRPSEAAPGRHRHRRRHRRRRRRGCRCRRRRRCRHHRRRRHRPRCRLQRRRRRRSPPRHSRAPACSSRCRQARPRPPDGSPPRSAATPCPPRRPPPSAPLLRALDNALAVRSRAVLVAVRQILVVSRHQHRSCAVLVSLQ